MQEWKEKIRIVRGRLAWASLPLCFCGLVLFDAALRFFYRAAGSTRFLDWRAFVFTGAWSLLLTGAAALRCRLWGGASPWGCTPCFSGCSRWCTG